MEQTGSRRASRCAAIRGNVVAAVIASSIAVLPGRASAATDCVDGPAKSPAWALLSDAAKSRICSGQSPAGTGVRLPAREVANDTPEGATAHAGRSSASIPPFDNAPTPVPSAWPRLADDEKTLVLMEEIRISAQRRQPEVRLTTSETTGLPQVQIAGENFAPPRTILISCARGGRPVALTSFVSGQLRNVASYDVDESVARMVRDERACRIAIAGVVVPVPADMVAMVWLRSTSNEVPDKTAAQVGENAEGGERFRRAPRPARR
jgi:hypothetical protein